MILVPCDTTPDVAKTSTKFTATASPETNANDLARVFGTTVPVPMHVPGRVYDLDEEPWFFAGAR